MENIEAGDQREKFQGSGGQLEETVENVLTMILKNIMLFP